MLRIVAAVVAVLTASLPAAAQEGATHEVEIPQGLGVQPGGAGPGVAGLSERKETPAGAARRAVLDELEQLRGEIAMLKALRKAQEALFAWNSLRIKSGEKPTALEGALCERVQTWCEVLPASFGRAAGEGLR